jgi:hypothetical protein
MMQLLPEDSDGWLRLLGVALKSVVEELLENADVGTRLSRYNENRKSFLNVNLKNEDDEDECRDIYVSVSVEMEDVVTEMIDREYKSEDHNEIMRDVAQHFRQLAQRLDDAASKGA